MSRPTRDKNGKFTGSIGEGKTSVPRSGLPTPPHAPTPDPAAGVPSVPEAYARFAALDGGGENAERVEALDEHGVEPSSIRPDITREEIEDALDSIEEGITRYRTSPVRPGSRDYDPAPEGMICDGFEALGYDSDEAYRKMTRVLERVRWEPGS